MPETAEKVVYCAAHEKWSSMAAGLPSELSECKSNSLLSQVSRLPRCEVYFYWLSCEVASSPNKVVMLSIWRAAVIYVCGFDFLYVFHGLFCFAASYGKQSHQLPLSQLFCSWGENHRSSWETSSGTCWRAWSARRRWGFSWWVWTLLGKPPSSTSWSWGRSWPPFPRSVCEQRTHCDTACHWVRHAFVTLFVCFLIQVSM